MRLGPLGLPEILIILTVLLLIFGARRLPEIGSSLGRSIRLFKSSVTGDEEREDCSSAEKSLIGLDRNADDLV